MLYWLFQFADDFDMDESPDCVTPECRNKATVGLAFCIACSASEHQMMKKDLEDIPHWLSLEAEFVDWCAVNGHPHPHS